MHGTVLEGKYKVDLLVEHELLRAGDAARGLNRVKDLECFIFAAINLKDLDRSVHEARRVHRVSAENLHGLLLVAVRDCRLEDDSRLGNASLVVEVSCRTFTCAAGIDAAIGLNLHFVKNL